MLAVQLAFLALSSQSSGVPLLSGYRGSSPVPISTALPLGELGCSRLGGRGFWASAERVLPQVGFRLSKIFLQYPVFLRTFATGRYSVAFAEQCSSASNSVVLVSSGLDSSVSSGILDRGDIFLSLPESRHRVGVDSCPGVRRRRLTEMSSNSCFFGNVSKLLVFGVLSPTSDLMAPATATFRQSCNDLPYDSPPFALFREVLF